MASIRLPGHTLFNEGAAFAVNENQKVVRARLGSGGDGRGLCTCGALSPMLPSGTQRKLWHRRHKEQVRMNQMEEVAGES